MSKNPMAWFAMLPLGTLIVLVNAGEKNITPDLFVGALVVAGSILLAAWGLITIVGEIIRSSYP